MACGMTVDSMADGVHHVYEHMELEAMAMEIDESLPSDFPILFVSLEAADE